MALTLIRVIVGAVIMPLSMIAFDKPDFLHELWACFFRLSLTLYTIVNTAKFEHPGNKRSRICCEVLDIVEKDNTPSDSRLIHGSDFTLLYFAICNLEA